MDASTGCLPSASFASLRLRKSMRVVPRQDDSFLQLEENSFMHVLRTLLSVVSLPTEFPKMRKKSRRIHRRASTIPILQERPATPTPYPRPRKLRKEHHVHLYPHPYANSAPDVRSAAQPRRVTFQTQPDPRAHSMRAQDLIPVPFPRTDSSTFTVPHNVADIEDTINALRELARGLDSSPNTSESSSLRKPRPLPSPPPYSSAPQSLRANSSAVALCEEPIVTRKSRLYLVHTPNEHEESRQASHHHGDDESNGSDRGTDFLSMTVSACHGHDDPWSAAPALPDSPVFSRPGTSLEARQSHAHSDSGTTLESELPLTPTSYTRLPRRISSRPLPRTPSQSQSTMTETPASNLARKALACSLGEQFTVDSVARGLSAGQPVFNEEPLVMVGYAI